MRKYIIGEQYLPPIKKLIFFQTNTSSNDLATWLEKGCQISSFIAITWQTLHVTTGVPPVTVVYDGGGTSSTEVTTSPPGGGTDPSPAFTAAWSMLDLKPWLEDVDSVKKNLRLWQLCQFCYVLNKTLWKIYWNQNTNQDLTCLTMASTLHFRYLAYFFRKRNPLSRGFFRDWKRSGTITKSLFLACCAAAHKRQPQASCFSVAQTLFLINRHFF